MKLFAETRRVLACKKEGKLIERARQEQLAKKSMIPVLRKQTLALLENEFGKDINNEISYLIVTVSTSYQQEFISVMQDLKDLYEVVQKSTTEYMVKQRIIEVY